NSRFDTVSCDKCPAGRYSNSINQTSLEDCIACGVGTFVTTSGASSCYSCEPGRYQDRDGSLGCLESEKGKFSNISAAEDSDDCRPCLIGSYSNDTGRSVCTVCVNGETTL